MSERGDHEGRVSRSSIFREGLPAPSRSAALWRAETRGASLSVEVVVQRCDQHDAHVVAWPVDRAENMGRMEALRFLRRHLARRVRKPVTESVHASAFVLALA